MIIPEIHLIFDLIFDLILFNFTFNFHLGTAFDPFFRSATPWIALDQMALARPPQVSVVGLCGWH